MVIDVGASSTRVCPVFEGYLLQKGACLRSCAVRSDASVVTQCMQVPVGGCDVLVCGSCGRTQLCRSRAVAVDACCCLFALQHRTCRCWVDTAWMLSC